jgi:hypothetical protein
MALLQGWLLSILHLKFVRLRCWYYWLQEIEKYDFRVVPGSVTFLPNLTQIRTLVLQLNDVECLTEMTDPCIRSSHKTHKKERTLRGRYSLSDRVLFFYFCYFDSHNICTLLTQWFPTDF